MTLTCLSGNCRQVVGRDLHATAIIGAQNLNTNAADFGIDADWVGQDKPKDSHSAEALDPAAIVINSEHVSFEKLHVFQPWFPTAHVVAVWLHMPSGETKQATRLPGIVLF